MFRGECVKLSEIEDRYQEIMKQPAGFKQDIQLAALLDVMEEVFHVPALENKVWEQNNKAVIAMYRKISLSRTTY